MTDIAARILEFLGTLIAGGAIVSLFTMKQTKEKAKLDNAAQLVEHYKELLDKAETSAEKANLQIEALSHKVSELERQCAVMQQQLDTCQLLYKQAAALRCEKINCNLRRPPIDKEALEQLGNMQKEVVDEHTQENDE